MKTKKLTLVIILCIANFYTTTLVAQNNYNKQVQEGNAKPYDKELAAIKEKLESGYYDADPYGISYGIADVGPKRSALYKEDEHGNIIDYWGNSIWDDDVCIGSDCNDLAGVRERNKREFFSKLFCILGIATVIGVLIWLVLRPTNNKK